MKLQFDPSLTYQQEAVAAVCDVFQGQTAKPALFTVADNTEEQFAAGQNLFGPQQGVGNRLRLDTEDILKNVRAVQARNGLLQSERLGQELHFDIEMETGTGKTYVYLRTLLELNKRYGFTKFIVVVPSIAIKEGVKKTLDITEDHFRELYHNVTYDYFVYDGNHIEKIRDFAVNTDIQIMVIGIDGFQKEINLINQDNDKKFGGARPIELLRETNPIVVIDEPQSTISTENRMEAVRTLNPLCTLRYSATPVRVENKLYKLDAVDSFSRKLVKGIEVDSFAVQDAHNDAYLCLKSVDNRRPPITAKIEIDKKMRSGIVQRKTITVRQGDDLYEKSGGRDVYAGYIVNDIYCAAGEEYVDFASRPEVLHLHETVGQIHADEIRRQQIRATIEEHLDKELLLRPKGIKVLSLFFIDKVANYRVYDDAGAHKGKYALWFEEIYRELIGKPKYKELRAALHGGAEESELIHDGYFSADKATKSTSERWKDTNGTTKADDSTYNLIMKEKEKLLSFDCKVRFIFSHSALKEGWDNPNVFQICTLNETASTIKKRQEIGRGLRLCVNQQGERQDSDLLGDGVYDTNVLTIVASESYKDFSEALQKELAESITSRPKLVTAELFRDKTIVKANGEKLTLSASQAATIMEELIAAGYVKKQKLTEKYFEDKKTGTIQLDEWQGEQDAIIKELDKVFNPDVLKVDNGRGKETAKFQAERFAKKEFQVLWKRINSKTYYEVDFEAEGLIQKSIEGLNESLHVTEIHIATTSGTLSEIHSREELEAGQAMQVGTTRVVRVNEAVASGVRYDLVGELVQRTGLKRSTIVAILKGITPETFGMYRRNPEEFIIRASNIINEQKAVAVIEHITYHKMNQEYDVSIFSEQELRGRIGIDAIPSEKSLYDLVVVDSQGVEKHFAEELERREAVEVYTKLPRGFYINTPVGKYNPDWAIVFREGEVKHIYFVAETKGSEDITQLRGVERAKIECASRHFASISDSQLKFGVVTNYETLYNKVMQE